MVGTRAIEVMQETRLLPAPAAQRGLNHLNASLASPLSATCRAGMPRVPPAQLLSEEGERLEEHRIPTALDRADRGVVVAVRVIVGAHLQE